MINDYFTVYVQHCDIGFSDDKFLIRIPNQGQQKVLIYLQIHQATSLSISNDCLQNITGRHEMMNECQHQTVGPHGESFIQTSHFLLDQQYQT